MSTIKDVAKKANVSTATVSRVINSPNVVSDQRKLRVLEAIKDLNYRPNEIARSLLKNETKLIGILVPDIRNIFSADTVSGISAKLQQSGYSTTLSVSNHDADAEMELVDMMLKKRVAGIIMLGARRVSHTPEHEDFLNSVSKSIPIVIDDYTNDCNMYCVRVDEAAGVYDAVKYLYDLGHRRIGFVCGQKELATYYYKDLAYRQAMTALGLADMAEKLSVEVIDDYSGGLEGARILLSRDIKPTAIFAAGDKMGIGVYYTVNSMGLKIPDDISVVGFSGSSASGYTYPSMTTVDQKPCILGGMVASVMIDILNGKEDINRNIIVKPSMLIRNSCRLIGPEL